VAELAEDLETNARNYSDIDLIFEKNQKKRSVAQEESKAVSRSAA
jgi:hypothetical protein